MKTQFVTMEDFFSTMQNKSYFLFAIALATTIPLLVCYLHGRKRKLNYPPIAGTMLDQVLNIDRLVEFMTDLSQKYRTFRILTPFFCNYVYTVEPENVEYILKTNFSNYGKGKFNYEILYDFFGDGLFAVDGDKWRQQRKIASFEFSAKVLRDYSSFVFRKNAAKLAKIVAEAARSNKMIEIQDLLMSSTLDSIFKVGFGVDLDTVTGTNKEGRAFTKAFDEASAQLLHRYLDVFWKLKRFMNIGSEATMRKNLNLIDEFVYKVIERKIEKLSENNAEKEDILSRFLKERERKPEGMSNKYLRDIILSFIIAGRDTTAGTISWLFYLLCKHPDVQEKVVKEVREATESVTGVKSSIDEFSASLGEEVLSQLHYLHACLTETLRLYPAVPVDVKYCFSDDTLPDGFAIKKGDMVNYQPYAMGRMKFLWGDDAYEFRPERWLSIDGTFVQENPYKFPVFQAGPRICLGKDFAYRQMKIFAATLLTFFKFKLWDENRMVKYRSMVTLQIDEGLYVCAEARQDAIWSS